MFRIKTAEICFLINSLAKGHTIYHSQGFLTTTFRRLLLLAWPDCAACLGMDWPTLFGPEGGAEGFSKNSGFTLAGKYFLQMIKLNQLYLYY